MQREEYLKQARKQKDIVMHYIKESKIIFSEITETVTADTRAIFLQWITQANMNSQKMGRTEYGQEYRLIRKQENLCTEMSGRRTYYAILCTGV